MPSTHPPPGPVLGPTRSMTDRRHHGSQPPLGAVSPIDRDSAPRVLSAQRQGYLGKTAMGGPRRSVIADACAVQCTPADTSSPLGKRRSATETPFRGRA